MISTGIVRSIDNLGRVVLPRLRNTYSITPDTPLEIFTDGESIVLRKYRAQRCLCILRRDFARRSFAAREVYLPGLPQGAGEIRHR